MTYVEHLVRSLFANHRSSLVSGKVFGPFLNQVFCFLLLSVLCIFWKAVLYQMCLLKIFFSQSVVHPIISILSFSEQNFFFYFMKSSISIISFMCYAFGVVSKSHCHTQGHLDFHLYYLLGVL